MILFLELIAQDIRYALRLMRSSMGLTTVAILSLALGIGTTTAIFSVVNALMLKPLPVLEPDRLVEVARSDLPNMHRYAIWKQFRDQQDILSSVFAYTDTRFDFSDGEERQSILGLYVSGDYFRTLGISATLGRNLLPSDDQSGATPVCVIGYDLWQQRYGQSGNVIGRVLYLGGHPVEVVGVAPKGFLGVEVGFKFDVYVPLAMEPVFASRRSRLNDPHASVLSIVGRLKPGVSVSQADAQLRVLGSAIYSASLQPKDNVKSETSLRSLTLTARPMTYGISYTRYVYGDTVLLLMVMAGVVLIITCANLSNLLLARATRRQIEIATRLALGASRWRLIQQLLTESIALSLAGATVGLIVMHWGTEVLVSAISWTNQRTFLDLSWDPRVVAFTIAAILLCALLSGLVPALRATDVSLYSVMKSGSTPASRSLRFSGAVLVVIQVTLSMTVLVSAGLLVRTVQALLAKDPGYDAKGVLVVEGRWAGSDESPQHQAIVGSELLEEFRSVPGVIAAARITASASRTMRPKIIVPMPEGGERHFRSFLFHISPGFFETRHTPLSGRDFGPADSNLSPAVAIISEKAAQTFFPGVNPIGLRFRQVDEADNEQEHTVEIVGVARNIDFQRPNDAPIPIVYRPILQCGASCSSIGSYELRFIGPLSDITKRVQNAAASVDSHLSLNFRSLADEAHEVIQRNRVTANIATFFGLLTGMLAMVGIYGVTSYAASLRTHEIGVRMALGAQPADVFQLVVGEAMSGVFVGVALGAVAGFGATQTIRGMLYGVTPADPLTFALAAFMMLLVAGIAAFLPARRASKTDPVVALRVE